MYFVNRLFAVLSMVTLLSGCQGPPSPTPETGPLEGAWQVVARSGADPDTSLTETNTQPGLYIFGNQHCSYDVCTRVRTEGPVRGHFG